MAALASHSTLPPAPPKAEGPSPTQIVEDFTDRLISGRMGTALYREILQTLTDALPRTAEGNPVGRDWLPDVKELRSGGRVINLHRLAAGLPHHWRLVADEAGGLQAVQKCTPRSLGIIPLPTRYENCARPDFTPASSSDGQQHG